VYAQWVPDSDYVPSQSVVRLEIGSYHIVDGITNEIIIVMSDMTPVLQDNHTLVPLRFVAYALDADVSWNPGNQEVTIALNGQVLTFAIGEPAPGMDVPAQLTNGRTMVPLGFIADFFGVTAYWDSGDMSITITR